MKHPKKVKGYLIIGSENYSGKRKLSYKLHKTTSELYTASTPLSDSDFNKVEKEIETIKNYPIFYVDTPGTVDQIRDTIIKFKEMYAKDKWLLVMLDHTLLVSNKAGESERGTLVNLERLFIEVKKMPLTTVIQLTQMNRNIEEQERILKPGLHFPQRSDISGSDALFQASDFVLVLHAPEKLGITKYGLKSWPTDNMIYLHLLKCREGEPKIIAYENNLKYNSLEEL